MERTAILCDLLGTRYPLMQGGMAHISDARLAAAVSNAGGLGILSAASGDPEKVAAMIDETRALTDKPFGLNIMLRGNNIKEIAELAAAKKVAVVTTGAGSPAEYIPMWREAGIKVIPVISTAAMAQLMENPVRTRLSQKARNPAVMSAK